MSIFREDMTCWQKARLFGSLFLAVWLAVGIVGLHEIVFDPGVVSAQSVIGSISGSVKISSRDPNALSGTARVRTADGIVREVNYPTYIVRIRDAMSGQILKIETLGAQGQFVFTRLPLGHIYLIELFDTSINHVVLTEGPIRVSSSTKINWRDIQIHYHIK